MTQLLKTDKEMIEELSILLYCSGVFVVTSW